MEIIGRITRDAQVRTIKKSDRKVVSFTLVVNDYYKSKEADKGTKLTTYFDCSYWINPGIAKYLLQGTLVEVQGRIYATAYNDKEGNAKASINCHVNSIKIHASANSKPETQTAETEEKEVLPF